MNICAGIVLYNPDVNRLKENVSAISSQVEDVILVDNASKNEDEIKEYLKENTTVKYIRFDKNYGIAKGLNRILKYALDNNYDAYVTLDQDSVCREGLVNKYKYYYSENIGQISCNIFDRNIGQMDAVEFGSDSVKEIEHCITSGCINNTTAVESCGGYDESLFIDGVDIDLSCNLRKHGYKILCINYDGLMHEFGDGRTINIGNKAISTANHKPWRNYYSRRNMIYVARKYYRGKKMMRLVAKQILYGVGAIVLEDQKMKRLKYNIKGIVDGLKRKK